MSILIKGMEMPLRCINCPFLTYYHYENRCLANRGKTIKFVIGKDRGAECPLVEIPTPHGRLIDADALFVVLSQDTDHWTIDEVSHIETEDVIDALVDAPTIIESEA